MKAFMIIAGIAVIIGILLIIVGLVMADFDAAVFHSDKMINNTYTVSETFEHIAIDNTEGDIRFESSPDGTCKIVCREKMKMPHTVTVQNNTASGLTTSGYSGNPRKSWCSCPRPNTIP